MAAFFFNIYHFLNGGLGINVTSFKKLTIESITLERHFVRLIVHNLSFTRDWMRTDELLLWRLPAA